MACSFLQRRGFTIVERNYLRKWGEIDIIARRGGILHFVEVKSIVSHETYGDTVTPETSRESSRHGNIRPEENMHPGKLKRLARTIQIYLLEKGIANDWQLDLVTVKISPGTRKARVELFENIII